MPRHAFPDRGAGDSSRQVDELLSPDSHAQRLKPHWWRALFPALPHGDDDGDDQSDSEVQSAGRSRALFPTAAAVREYIALQLVRLQLLQRIRNSLMSGARTRARIRHHYAQLSLDVHLLSSIRALCDFDASVLELVHDCSSDELQQLQRQNLQLTGAMLRTLRLLTLEPEGAAPPDTAPLDAATLSVADRLCQRNSAEILLSILEAHFDQLPLDSEAHESPRAVPSGDSELRALRCSLVEDALRCLFAQLGSVTAGSAHRVSLVKQIYLHIPSQLHTPPLSAIRALAECDAGAGSPSEIIRMLIQLAACAGSAALAELSVGILSHVARTRVPNEHVHSAAVCGNSEHSFYTRPLCTRGSPPTPVITYPAYTNSTLAVASKLFVFPRDPAQYLAERGLLTALVQKLQPFLLAPANAHAHLHAHAAQMGKAAPSRSMFGRSKGRGEEEEEEDSDSALGAVLPMPLPCSPLSRSVRSSSHAHDASPHHHGLGHRGGEEDSARHASLVAQAAVMDELYCTPKVAEADPALLQFPMSAQPDLIDCGGVPALELAPPALGQRLASGSVSVAVHQPTPHHRSAPPHQSNAAVATALRGLAALSAHNAAVSAQLCGQPGLLSFLSSCLAHGHGGLRLLASELVSGMERSLACAIGSAGASEHSDHLACASHRPAAGAASYSLLAAAQQLAAAGRPRSLSRRNSESAGGGPGRVPKSSRDRRNSRDLTHSPHVTPSSPLLQAHKLAGGQAGSSPRLLALAAPALASHRSASGSQLAGGEFAGGQQSALLTPSDAHEQLAPLVQRTLQLLLSTLRQQLGGSDSQILTELRARAVAQLDHTALQQSISSLGTLAAHSAQLQEQASAAVPLLSALLRQTASAPLRLSAMRALAALCWRHPSNRLAAVESEVVHTLMGLLAQLHPTGAARVASTRAAAASPAAVELQQAALHLFTRLGRFALAEDLIAPSSAGIEDSTLEALAGPQAVAALMVRLLSLLDSASPALRAATARLLGELLLPRSPVRDMLVRAGVVAKLARLSGESYAWQAADAGQSTSIEAEGDCACSGVGPLAPAQQLRVLALQALAQLTTDAPLAFKRAVLDELSVDGLLAPLVDAESGDDPARAVHCACECACRGSRQLESQGWSLLRAVLEPPTPSDADESPTSAESGEDPLMSARDLARVLDCVVANVGRIQLQQQRGVELAQAQKANDSSVSSPLQLLAAIAARSDASKALICARPQLLQLLHAALQQQAGAAARWGSIALARLLQRADGELEVAGPPPAGVAPSSVQSSLAVPPVVGRARALLEHDGLFPQLLRMAAPPTSESETCAVSASLRQPNPAAAATADSCPSLSSDASEVRSRSTQCLLLMHAALKAGASAAAAPLQSERGVLLEDFIRSLPTEMTNQARKTSEPLAAAAAPPQEADEPSANSVPSPSPTPAPLLSVAEPSSADVHESDSAEEAENEDDDDHHAVTDSDAGDEDSGVSAWELFMDAGSNPAAAAESDDLEAEDHESADTPSQSELAADRRGRDSAILRDLAAEARSLAFAVRATLSPPSRPQSDDQADESRRLLLTLAARLVSLHQRAGAAVAHPSDI